MHQKCICFCIFVFTAGLNLDTLFVTTGAVDLNLYSNRIDHINGTAYAGQVFLVTGLGVTGMKGDKLCL